MALVRAVHSFVIPGRRMVAKDTVLDDSDPIVAMRPDLFTAITADKVPGGVVEQATAAPGEKRATKRTAAKPKS